MAVRIYGPELTHRDRARLQARARRPLIVWGMRMGNRLPPLTVGTAGSPTPGRCAARTSAAPTSLPMAMERGSPVPRQFWRFGSFVNGGYMWHAAPRLPPHCDGDGEPGRGA